ncbi:uncharacterized protein LOC136072540 [Hydra vulgaris]|uniref:uncharacterized protein LOC136072540 n=1 Tax=Hydra vulgaris TaxID=6087 RepID=UPI0032EA5404
MPLKKTTKRTRNTSEIFLVKKTSETLQSNKLPTGKDITEEAFDSRKSARDTANDLNISHSSASSHDSNSDSDFEADIDKEESGSSILLPKDILQKTALTAIGEGLSARQHTAIVSSIIANSGGSVSNFVVSSTTSFRAVEKVLTKEGEKIRKQIFTLAQSSVSPIILHFDSKIVKELTDGKELQLHRLAVLIRIKGQTELLGIPHLTSSTGEEQKTAILKLLNQFEIIDKFHGCVFDTTNFNTGKQKGVCIKLATEVEMPLLLLACRHHVYESHIVHCWNIYPSSNTNGQDNPFFKRLKLVWNSLDHDSTVLNRMKIEDITDNWLQDQLKKTLEFSEDIIKMEKMKKNGCRCDYLELAELTVMVLSGDVQ